MDPIIDIKVTSWAYANKVVKQACDDNPNMYICAVSIFNRMQVYALKRRSDAPTWLVERMRSNGQEMLYNGHAVPFTNGQLAHAQNEVRNG